MKRLNIYSVIQVKEKGGLYNLQTSTIRSPIDAYRVFEEVLNLSKKTREHFAIVTLNVKNTVVGVHELHVGSLNASVVHPRDIFQAALLNNAASIIACHNHPSGTVVPSKEDIDVTERIKQAGEILGIELLDHIIIGEENFLSLREKGYI